MEENYPQPTQDYTVVIRCMTYNHEKYIEDALKGFVMQKTDFPFCAIVVDDCSSDGTAEIIRKYENKYPDIIKGIYLKENYTSQRKSKEPITKPWINHCQFIALCEGDDYWIDPYKLQKQVDYLQNHPEVILVHTGFYFHYDSSNELKECTNQEKALTRFEKMRNIVDYNQYRIQTCTILMKSGIREAIIASNPQAFDKTYFLMGDTQLWIFILNYGDIHYLPERTSIYRIHEGSACRRGTFSLSKLRFDLSCSEMRLFLINKFNLGNDLKEKIKTTFYKQLLLYSIFNPQYKPLFPSNTKNKIAISIATFPVIRKLLKKYIEKTKKLQY